MTSSVKPQTPDVRDDKYAIKSDAQITGLTISASTGVVSPPPYPPLDSQVFDNEFTPVRRQTDPSCAVHGPLAAFEHSYYRIVGTKPVLSGQFLYWVTRQLAYPRGDGPVNTQVAVTQRDTLKALMLYGVCPENQWTERVGAFADEPPSDRFVHALKYRVKRYNTVALELLYTVLQIHVAVACIVMTYQDWYSGDMYSPDGGITPAPRCQVAPPGEGGAAMGYHSLVLSGFDHTRGCLRVRNSWGDIWADGGYAWVPESFVAEGDIRDFWAVTHVRDE